MNEKRFTYVLIPFMKEELTPQVRTTDAVYNRNQGGLGEHALLCVQR